jgi:hypothetical protein
MLRTSHATEFQVFGSAKAKRSTVHSFARFLGSRVKTMAVSKKKRSAASIRDIKIEEIPTAKLTFDRDNPRLHEIGIPKGATDDEITGILWREMEVEELALSIGLRGFFRQEPLFAIHETHPQFTVVEGNRRLAAVRILLDPKLQRSLKITALPQLSPNERAELETLPVVVTTRDDVWEFIGFRHVNGPRPWGALSKAEYIAKVHFERKIPLERISSLIGDRHDTVKRLFRGLMVIHQAEDMEVYKLSDRSTKRLYFSHLYTGLDYPGFQRFLGIKEATSYVEKPVPKNRRKELGELCLWLFGSRSRNVRPLIRSQNPDLRRLERALMTDTGVDALRSGLPLDAAYDASIGDEQIFREALISARIHLQRAHGTVHTGYSGKNDLFANAEDLYKLAGSLLDLMESIRSPETRRRRGTLPK